MARKVTAYVATNGLIFVLKRRGKYEITHEGTRYELEYRIASRHEPGSGWHLYGGDYFGEQLFSGLDDSIEDAAKIITKTRDE